MASLGTRPVVSVIPSTKRKEAVEITNSSPLSLDAAVFTDSYDRALSLADELEAGTVRINGAPGQGFGDIPFGGHQNSGIGREGLHTSIYELLRTKSIIL